MQLIEKEINFSSTIPIALTLWLCLVGTFAYAQQGTIKVVETQSKNRITFFAENRTYTDYDVLFEVKGTNFRQSAAKPRWIRVPAASKVHLKTIILLRDKTPVYSKIFKTNDSLSKRAVKKEFTKLNLPPPKVKPKKQITIYTYTGCGACDSIVEQLNTQNFLFRSVSLDEKPDVKEQLGKFLSKSTQEMDSLSGPIISLGGKLYSWITSFDQMMEEVEKD
ncbi:glutaredoxin domain-containing protein [Flagellimonas meridianipacifica]|uniref:Glutaredoxin n=1 Tax=Flagellimonas meridianipacifica TaxID=1080225 RepID=A0A2T0MBW6_9FLAO|nr:glutaredoxin domain-containing protein [Allomuricauda pacifica]PRX54980.1 glutaredoxin [Allomuricauda pacifica]